MINTILDEIIKGLQERSSDIFYDFHESGDVDLNDNPVDPADSNALPGRYQAAIEHLCVAAERAEAILQVLKARPDLALRLFTEIDMPTEGLQNPLPLEGEFEFTTGPWTVESHPDTEGAYIVKEARHEQQIWGPDGYDISDEEGDRRDLIVERRDAGNVLLIQLAPLLFRSLGNLLFITGTAKERDNETANAIGPDRQEIVTAGRLNANHPGERREGQWHD